MSQPAGGCSSSESTSDTSFGSWSGFTCRASGVSSAEGALASMKSRLSTASSSLPALPLPDEAALVFDSDLASAAPASAGVSSSEYAFLLAAACSLSLFEDLVPLVPLPFPPLLVPVTELVLPVSLLMLLLPSSSPEVNASSMSSTSSSVGDSSDPAGSDIAWSLSPRRSMPSSVHSNQWKCSYT